MTFHFSAVFVLIFVALASRAQPVVKFGSAIAIALLLVAIVKFAPQSLISVWPEEVGYPEANWL